VGTDKVLKIKKIILWILILGWMTIIFLFSSQNADESSALSEGFLRRFILWFLPDNISTETVDLLEHIVRKCAHMTEYAVLSILISMELRLYVSFKLQWKYIVISVILVMLYAATDEFHQLFIGGRSGQVKDVLIDTLGGLIGACIVSLVIRIRKKQM
jgi:VanZ family protein